ncbi:alkaline phosphatase family protein [Algoriphagus pacificus]|uniref:Alkaline phosphatase family protein n=1 Tax=Algoriphagus pacificus TaxID=2811234 RepID=A0ABS3CBQ7_9BACT|nr:alkaline phosphatase family protein [Algoriphagus pacificus]MBN7814442.1 alkaline phosphatase family protein [Algoriphagus pacificus]
MKKFLLAASILLVALQSCTSEKQQEKELKSKKVLFVIVDGIPYDVIDSVETPNLDKIISEGGIMKATMGGEKDGYSQTPTISAVGYNSVLTGVWANKHNVWGNGIKDPNYNYSTVFRLFKDQFPDGKTAIFSTWLDNRTKLVGDGLPQTGNLKIDTHFDGLELDTVNYPHDDERTYIHLIDEEVSKTAAKTISENAPDLSWMYLEFTDDMSHRYGNSPQFVDAVKKADIQIGRVWDAIKEREANFQEDWLLVITTDHGREDDGHGHGGQSDRERSIWIATNAKNKNSHFQELGQTVDILPSIANFMGLDISRDQAMELDGTPFIGDVSASNFKATLEDNTLSLSWNSLSNGEKGKVWFSYTNDFKTGGKDQYEELGEVELDRGSATFDLASQDSSFLKVILETPSGFLNYWILAKE